MEYVGSTFKSVDIKDSILSNVQINDAHINGISGNVDDISISNLDIENIYMSNKPGEPDKKTGQFWMKAGGNSYLSAPLLTLGGIVKIEIGDSLMYLKAI